MTITIRNCQERDVDAIRQFIHTIENLDYHTPFSYWVLFKYFAGLCFILEKDGEIIGFISGIIDEGGKIFYVWQLAIAPAYRGQNLGGFLFEQAIKVAIDKECHVLHVSIAPDNYQSFSAISKAVDKNGLEIKKVGQVDFCDSLSNYHQWENLYEVKLASELFM
ncbi:MAG: GNAT family N-acetyltransferase [Okeania sp. SIO2C2]|uniref:GNAT family N-acetyltransferase n=1 Tax=Okeania sp. SIO2C2 TaxID=2607787 RepID=UPI0013BD8041|nr:GNAT family N-acetyltransferase [Okeania sp. SIO2C2]NEP88092.1 GNAT family N-acetyltransferase [Okeania sp. SIO2C2]